MSPGPSSSAGKAVDILFRAGGVDKLLTQFDQVAAKVESVTDKALAALQRGAMTAVVTPLTDVFKGILARVDSFVSSLRGLAYPLEKLAQPVLALTKSLAGLATSAAGAAKGLFDSAAGGVTSAVGKMSQSVGAISPASTTRSEYAFADLQATIGEKLLPLFDQLSGIVERFGDYLANLDLSSLLESVGKVVGVLADAFFTLLEAAEPLIETLANALSGALDTLMPFLESFAEALAQVLDAVSPLVDLIGTALGEALALFKPVVDLLITALDKLVDAFFDAVNFVADMVESLTFGMVDMHLQRRNKEERDAGKGARKERASAAKGVSMGGIEDISRRALEAAGRMGVESNTRRTADATEKTAELMREFIKQNKVDPETAKVWMDRGARKTRDGGLMAGFDLARELAAAGGGK